MKRIKFLSISMLAVLLCGVIAFSACKKESEAEKEAGQAVKEMCPCYEAAKKVMDSTPKPIPVAVWDKMIEDMENCLEKVADKYTEYNGNKEFEQALLKKLIEKCDSYFWLELEDEE